MGVTGKYFLIKSKSSGLVLDVAGASSSPGAAVLLWSIHERDNQVWYVDPVAGTINSKSNNLCLDLGENNRLIVNVHNPGNTNQKWRYNYDKKVFENEANPSLVLDVMNDSKEEGATTIAYQYHGQDNQKWKLKAQPIQYFVIKSSMNGKVMDVDGGRTEPGAKVIMYGRKDSDNQLWFEDFQGNIRSKLNEDLILDGSGDVLRTGSYSEGNRNAYWVKSGNRIVNKFEHHKVLDIKGASSDDLAEICVWDYKGSPNQHWEIDYV